MPYLNTLRARDHRPAGWRRAARPELARSAVWGALRIRTFLALAKRRGPVIATSARCELAQLAGSLDRDPRRALSFRRLQPGPKVRSERLPSGGSGSKETPKCVRHPSNTRRLRRSPTCSSTSPTSGTPSERRPLGAEIQIEQCGHTRPRSVPPGPRRATGETDPADGRRSGGWPHREPPPGSREPQFLQPGICSSSHVTAALVLRASRRLRASHSLEATVP